jgi:hypothetical protein
MNINSVNSINGCVFTYSDNFDHFHMERPPYILHSVFTPTKTTIIYNDPVQLLYFVKSVKFFAGQ